jgi:hypothetical protein
LKRDKPRRSEGVKARQIAATTANWTALREQCGALTRRNNNNPPLSNYKMHLVEITSHAQ